MCNAVCLIKTKTEKANAKSIIDFLKSTMNTQKDGLVVYNGKNHYKELIDYDNAYKTIKGSPDVVIMHSRTATKGRVNTDNIHGWEHSKMKGVYFYHNGWCRKPTDKQETKSNSLLDSYITNIKNITKKLKACKDCEDEGYTPCNKHIAQSIHRTHLEELIRGESMGECGIDYALPQRSSIDFYDYGYGLGSVDYGGETLYDRYKDYGSVLEEGKTDSEEFFQALESTNKEEIERRLSEYSFYGFGIIHNTLQKQIIIIAKKHCYCSDVNGYYVLSSFDFSVEKQYPVIHEGAGKIKEGIYYINY